MCEVIWDGKREGKSTIFPLYHSQEGGKIEHSRAYNSNTAKWATPAHPIRWQCSSNTREVLRCNHRKIWRRSWHWMDTLYSILHKNIVCNVTESIELRSSSKWPGNWRNPWEMKLHLKVGSIQNGSAHFPQLQKQNNHDDEQRATAPSWIINKYTPSQHVQVHHKIEARTFEISLIARGGLILTCTSQQP
jgi:hypothetical protein